MRSNALFGIAQNCQVESLPWWMYQRFGSRGVTPCDFSARDNGVSVVSRLLILLFIEGETRMAMLVHLAPESRAALIRRNGIRRLRRAVGDFPGGVFAVPMTRNFYISHQWLRELKRRNQGAIVGVYFRVPDEERVWVGHYNQHHRWMSAAEAAAEFLAAADVRGWEVVIPRRIEAAEVHRVRQLPQVVGWRFSPTSKGKPPFCTCKFCTRGEYGARRLRERMGS